MIRRIAVVAALTCASPAAARDFLYPWKAGVAAQQASDDQGQCVVQAREVEKGVNAGEQARARGQPAPAPPGGSKAWLAPGIDGMTAFLNSYYDCLRDRGYVIRRMPSKEYAALKKAGGKGVFDAMAAPETTHAAVPPGTIR